MSQHGGRNPFDEYMERGKTILWTIFIVLVGLSFALHFGGVFMLVILIISVVAGGVWLGIYLYNRNRPW